MDVSVNLGLPIGSITMFHTFNNTVEIPRGWMICSGSQVTQAAYDSLHGSGFYTADQVGSSPLAGKYLPNFVGKYPYGANSTSESGATAMPSTGNNSHQVNISHNHQWYDSLSADTTDSTWNSSGVATSIGTTTKTTGSGISVSTGSATLTDSYTSNGGSTALNIQPESIPVLFIIKVA